MTSLVLVLMSVSVFLGNLVVFLMARQNLKVARENLARIEREYEERWGEPCP
jgi:hypothetical protein